MHSLVMGILLTLGFTLDLYGIFAMFLLWSARTAGVERFVLIRRCIYLSLGTTLIFTAFHGF